MEAVSRYQSWKESKNPTGITPVHFKILILVDEVEDKSAGGIYLPDNAREREQLAHDKGMLVAVSEMAFSNPKWTGTIPVVGDKVIFNKYAGSIVQYRSQKHEPIQKYRLCNDTDIVAIVEQGE